jgi:hypothetical protein
MGQQVCMGAVTRCSYGAMPSSLMVAPLNGVYCGTPAATVMDNKPLVNVLPFGLCRSMGNPMVASATVAAMGSLVPMPCLPLTTTPWSPGSPTVQIAGQGALTQGSKLSCSWGGVIGIDMAGQFTVLVA